MDYVPVHLSCFFYLLLKIEQELSGGVRGSVLKFGVDAHRDPMIEPLSFYSPAPHDFR